MSLMMILACLVSVYRLMAMHIQAGLSQQFWGPLGKQYTKGPTIQYFNITIEVYSIIINKS